MPFNYHVKRAFAYDGRYYTRGNAAEIADLPRRIRDPLIANGSIVEQKVDAEEAGESAGEQDEGS